VTMIHHEVLAKCSPEKVWALLADLEAVQRYNSTVRSASVKGAQRSGVGAVRVCELNPKGQVTERVTQWDNQRSIGFEVSASDWPINYMRWTTRIEPAASAATRITQDLEYQVKFGPLGWLLDNLVMKRKLKSTLDGVFAEMIKQAERIN
jgi:ribosome-associated toxin RatA of RatAB toxin-antitoxin module